MHQLTIGQYKNLNLTGPELFTDSDVDKAVVESVINAGNNWAKANLPIERGDKITIEVEAKLDGLTVPELCNSALNYAIGDPSMMPEFETAMGKKLGDTFAIDITFGEKAPLPRLANQTVHIEAKIKDVAHLMSPNIDDAFVQKLDPTIQTLAELKTRFEEVIRENGLENIRDQRIQMVLEAIINSSECIYDDTEFKALYERILFQTRTMMANTQLPQMTQSFEDQRFLDDCRELTQRTIKEELIVKEVAAKEGITITDEEFTANKAKFTQTPEEQAEFEKYFSSDEIFRSFLLKEKVVDQLVAWNIANC